MIRIMMNEIGFPSRFGCALASFVFQLIGVGTYSHYPAVVNAFFVDAFSTVEVRKSGQKPKETMWLLLASPSLHLRQSHFES